jgi:hypothetical protein
VVLKWYLEDEEFEETALGLLHHYAKGNIGLVAPSLIEYELANGLLIACRRGQDRCGRCHNSNEGVF